MSNWTRTNETNTLVVPVEVSESERIELGQRMAQLQEKAEEELIQAKCTMRIARETAKDYLAEAKKLRKVVITGKRDEEIEAELYADYDAGLVRYVPVGCDPNEDAAVLHERDLHDSERQQTIPDE